MTLRRALENSKNLATAHLLDGGIAGSPPESLDKICAVAKEAQLYQICERYYPFILGAQPVRPLDMAVFYASIANEGLRPTPHVIEFDRARRARRVYRAQPKLTAIGGVDRAGGVPASHASCKACWRAAPRARSRHHSAFVGGKTGTSDDENDAWFVGFSNDVTIAVWVGYDNKRGKRTLGGGQTGGKVAVPIFEPIMQAVWQHHAPKTALRGPSPEASRQLVAMQIDLQQRRAHRRLRRSATTTASASTWASAPQASTGRQRRVHRISADRPQRPRGEFADRIDLARATRIRSSGTIPGATRSTIHSGCSAATGRPSPFFVTPNDDPRFRDSRRSNVAELGRPARQPAPAPRPEPNYGNRQQQHRVY